jgi:glycosyltransferase involved in cell wall biosynthesis
MTAVSVIIPTYKHAKYVLETIDSVFAQSFGDYEIIVINDGSPDDTAEVLRPLAESRRIRYIEQTNAGQAAARNRGLAEAKGEFVAFLDDDDLWPADKLEWQVGELQRDQGAVLAYGYGELFGSCNPMRVPERAGPAGEVYEAFVPRNWMCSPGQALIRRSALEKVGGFDRRVWGADDWDMFLSLSRRGRFVYRERLALKYRVHEGNASRDALRMYVNSCRVYRKHAGLVRGLVGRHIFHGIYGVEVMRQAREQMAAKQWKAAQRLWWTMLVCKPTRVLRREIVQNLLRCASMRMFAMGKGNAA